MPFNSKASPGWLRKYPRTDDFASAGGWLTAAVSTLLASGWPSRYPLAAFSTPLEVAASPLAEQGSGAAPAAGEVAMTAATAARTQPEGTLNALRRKLIADFLIGASPSSPTIGTFSTSAVQRNEKPGPTWGPGFSLTADLEVHTAHATGRVADGSGGLLRLVGNDGLGGQKQARDGRRVLQRRTGHLDRVGDARLQ